ncbi:MAG: hypothetical protein AAFN78_01550 [Pseudomonadota bacterium]
MITKTPTLAFCLAAFLTGCGAHQSIPDSSVAYAGQGTVVDYYASGTLKREASYSDGNLVSSTQYFASGREKSHEEFADGVLVSATYYFESGRVRSQVSPTGAAAE